MFAVRQNTEQFNKSPIITGWKDILMKEEKLMNYQILKTQFPKKFIELEKQTANTPESIEKGQSSLQKLMEKLEIDPSNLESHSYSDLLQA